MKIGKIHSCVKLLFVLLLLFVGNAIGENPNTVNLEGGTLNVIQVQSENNITREVRIVSAIITTNCSDFDTSTLAFETSEVSGYDSASECHCWDSPLSTGTHPTKIVVNGTSSCDTVCRINPDTCSANGQAVVTHGMYLCDNGWCMPSIEECASVGGWTYGQNGEGVWYRTQRYCVPKVTHAPSPPCNSNAGTVSLPCQDVKSAYQGAQCCTSNNKTVTFTV